MKITLIVEATIQVASNEVCDQFRQPRGTLEIISEGTRVAWAKDVVEAIKTARGLISSDLTVKHEIGE